MLSKILTTVLALALAQQRVNAQDSESNEMDVMTMAGDEATDLLLTESSTEPMQGEEEPMATTATQDEEMADEKEMMEEALGPLDMTGELLHYPMPESCLSKSFTIGTSDGVENFSLFDNTEEILLRMTDHHHAHDIQICTHPETGYIHSLALHFEIEMKEEGASDKNDSITLGGGPEGGECTTESFGDHTAPDFAILFRNETETLITGFGMFFTDEYFIRYGVGTTERIKIDLTEEESVVGMFGAQSEAGLHELGLILSNTTCVEQKAEAMRLELELLRLAALAQPEDDDVMEEESSSSVLIVVIIIVVVVIIIVIIVVIILKKKKNRVSKVTVLGAGKDSKLPGTQNNSASLPNVETDDDHNYLGSGRGKSKETERDLVLANHD